MDELRLTLLGQPQLTRGGKPAGNLFCVEAEALLYYLAVTGRARSHKVLADLLWGDLPEVDAQANLRETLYDLGRHFAPYLTTTHKEVAFDRKSCYWLDVAAFCGEVGEALLLPSVVPVLGRAKKTTGHGVLTPERIAALTRAVELYRGDFLEGFDMRDAPAFEEWVLDERGCLRQLALQALRALAAHHMVSGTYTVALNAADRLLALSPYQESAHRQKMLLLALNDQREAALAQYEMCRRALVQELGIEPAVETTVLYERIRTGKLRG